MMYTETTVTAYERLHWPPAAHHHYYVSPRYSPGSPALVDLRTASRVAADELEFYANVLEGLEGPAAQERARTLGLRGIIEAQRDRREGMEIYDVLTGESFWRGLVTIRELREGDRVADSDLANLPNGLVVKSATRENATFICILDTAGYWHYPPARHHIRIERKLAHVERRA